MPSISQNPYPDRLPDFLNLGVWLRTVIIAVFFGLGAVIVRSQSWSGVVEDFSIAALHFVPVLVITLALLGVVAKGLGRIPYAAGVTVVLALTMLVTLVMRHLTENYLRIDVAEPDRHVIYSLVVAAFVLAYFNLRSRALSPAIAEARLQALQARIRPHFLFNSLNAVLSLVRSEPRRAETALEDMADLFRVLMADNRNLAPLADEVELCRQYLAIEQLRLGERLQIEWHVENMPKDAMVPPLILQPLLENAVYHGIEPAPGVGTVNINIYHVRGEVHMVLKNPYYKHGSHHSGNKMALNNIRERLALHFDAEAALESTVLENAYQVHIRVPYVKAANP